MVKIPLNATEIEQLLQWRDRNKDKVRAGIIPFHDCQIIVENSMQVKVNCADNVYTFTVSNLLQHEILGKFSVMIPGFTVKNLYPVLKQDQMQDCLTVWASVQAYILNHEPEKVQRERKAKQDTTKPCMKKIDRVIRKNNVIYLKNIVYVDDVNDQSYQESHRKAYTKPNHSYGVRGHYRHYKSGKTVYVKPYEKNLKSSKGDMSKVLKLKMEE